MFIVNMSAWFLFFQFSKVMFICKYVSFLFIFIFFGTEFYIKERQKKVPSHSENLASSDGFFLTLPTDGSTFPIIRLSSKTLLPQTINLKDGEWEVGLTEIMYASSIENIFDKGLARCMFKIWKTLGHPNQETNMRLVYYEEFDRIEYRVMENSAYEKPFLCAFTTLFSL